MDITDEMLDNLNIPLCSVDAGGVEIWFNRHAEQLARHTGELKRILLGMPSDDMPNRIADIGGHELLILEIGRNNGKRIFALLDTGVIEGSISATKVMKATRDETDAILSSIHDDILITDGEGIIVRAFPSFEKVYNVKKEDAEGRSVFDLEREGVFTPSVTSIVLNKNQPVTMMQENRQGRKIIVTATPIRDSKGKIIKVISFSRDLTDFLNLKEQYELQEQEIRRYAAEIENLREKNINIPGYIAHSKIMKNISEMVDRVAGFDANIVLEGESGVGKTMYAKLIHSKSQRSQGPFIEIDCGSIPENLLESELFGYEKGAFTGASQSGKIGLIQLADKGTLFFDEIGELPLNLQMKLLKVIQEKKITRVGGTKVIDVDFRLIAATNRNLRKMVAEHRFREDLYYRLNVISITIPSLRERTDDIFSFAMYFLNTFNQKYHLHKTLAPEVIDALNRYSWPGNIRELENLVERMILTTAEDRIGSDSLPEHLRTPGCSGLECNSLPDALDALERQLIVCAYQKHHTTTGVARELGISQPTAVRKIQKYLGKEHVFDNE